MEPNKPAVPTPGFLTLLREATATAPAEIQDLVKKTIEIHNLEQTMAYYEIQNRDLVKNLIGSVVRTAHEKMNADCENHQLGATSFHNVLLQAVAFAIVAGASLSKNKTI